MADGSRLDGTEASDSAVAVTPDAVLVADRPGLDATDGVSSSFACPEPVTCPATDSSKPASVDCVSPLTLHVGLRASGVRDPAAISSGAQPGTIRSHEALPDGDLIDRTIR